MSPDLSMVAAIALPFVLVVVLFVVAVGVAVLIARS